MATASRSPRRRRRRARGSVLRSAGGHDRGVGPMGHDQDDAFDVKNRSAASALVRDPHPRLRELREECPVHAGSVSGLFGMVGPDNYLTPDDEPGVGVRLRGRRPGLPRPRDVLELLLRAVRCGRCIGRTILEMDPPDHQRYRLAAAGGVHQGGDGAWEADFVRDLVASRLAALAPLGRGDLATDFAFHYPISVIVGGGGPARRARADLLRAGDPAHQRGRRRGRPPGGQRATWRRWSAGARRASGRAARRPHQRPGAGRAAPSPTARPSG